MRHPKYKTKVTWLARISDTADRAGLDRKIKETARAHDQLPGAAALEALGAHPIIDPDTYGARLVTEPGLRAAVVALDGRARALLALASATKTRKDRPDNAFVELLREHLTEHPTDLLVVADFARLLRRIDLLSATFAAVRDGCHTLLHGQSRLDLHGPAAEQQFMMMALMAIAEAKAVVRRTTVGRMRLVADGGVPWSNESLPLGLAKDEDRRPVLAEDQRAVVRTIIEQLADPDLTNSERVKNVEAAGHPTRRSPSDEVARWYRWLDVWSTGTLRRTSTIPVLLHDQLDELPGEIADDHFGEPVWHAEITFGVPAGGWAPTELIEQALARRADSAARQTQTGRSVGAPRKPFCLRPAWQHGNQQFGLLSRAHGLYELRRRPMELATRTASEGPTSRPVAAGWTPQSGRAGQVAAVVSAAHLHRSVVDGVLDALTQGTVVRRGADALLNANAADRSQLASDLAALRRQAENARRCVLEATSDDERAQYQRMHRDLTGQATELEQHLLAASIAGGDVTFETGLRRLVMPLAALRDVDDHVPREVADALNAVLTDFRLVPDGDQGRWQVNVAVPLEAGQLIVGPITGSVELGTHRTAESRRAASLARRSDEAVRWLLRDGMSVAAIAERLELSTVRRVEQSLRDELASQFGLQRAAASFLVARSPAVARSAVWAGLTGERDRDLNPAWVHHVTQAYMDPDLRWYRPDSQCTPRRLIAMVADQGGWMPATRLQFAERAGLAISTVGRALGGHPQRGRPPYLAEADGGMTLLDCPRPGCRGRLSLYSNLPEVAVSGWLLCASCLRPAGGYRGPSFPDVYATAGGGSGDPT